MRAFLVSLSLLALLSACKFEVNAPDDDQKSQSPVAANVGSHAANPTPATAVDSFASRDLPVGETLPPSAADDVPRPVMQAQVVLDRLGFTPGVVDGREGASTANAIRGFQEASDLPQSGKLDDATKKSLSQWSNIPATRVVSIPADFAAGPYVKIPAKVPDQAMLPAMGYESLDEKLAERFHTTVATLIALNPSSDAMATPSTSASPTPTPSPSPSPSGTDAPPPSHFQAGQQIRVPNIGADRIEPGSVSDAGWQATLAMLGVGSTQPSAARVVVSKSKGTLKAYDAADKLIAVYTATMGSSHDPLPLGQWKITTVARNPPFHYNPKLFWDVADSKSPETLRPGPNSPVGVVWIDISKPHYGIHGTPRPETIGRAESHGCVRLTNWDAARLAQMVSTKTQLLFEA